MVLTKNTAYITTGEKYRAAAPGPAYHGFFAMMEKCRVDNGGRGYTAISFAAGQSIDAACTRTEVA
jgi:hypothetical protein